MTTPEADVRAVRLELDEIRTELAQLVSIADAVADLTDVGANVDRPTIDAVGAFLPAMTRGIDEVRDRVEHLGDLCTQESEESRE